MLRIDVSAGTHRYPIYIEHGLTAHLGRPVFGGVTAGPLAYDTAGNFVGTTGAVNRTVSEGSTIRVDVA